MLSSRPWISLLFVALTSSEAVAAENGVAAFDLAMQPVLEAYLKIQVALAADRMEGVVESSQLIAKLAAKLDLGKVSGDAAAHYRDLPAQLVEAATALAKVPDIARARVKLRDLSAPMAEWATFAQPAGISVAFCPMASGKWLQKQGELRNPYYGTSMLTCGRVVAGAGAPIP